MVTTRSILVKLNRLIKNPITIVLNTTLIKITYNEVKYTIHKQANIYDVVLRRNKP